MAFEKENEYTFFIAVILCPNDELSLRLATTRHVHSERENNCHASPHCLC